MACLEYLKYPDLVESTVLVYNSDSSLTVKYHTIESDTWHFLMSAVSCKGKYKVKPFLVVVGMCVKSTMGEARAALET